MTPPPERVHDRVQPARRPRAARPARAQPRLDLGRRDRAVLAEVDPAGLAAASGNPVAMLAGASPARLEELAADAGFRERLASAAARLDERLAAPELVRDAARCAARDRLLLARVRPQRGAAAVLGRPRHPRRRPPQGGQRPGRADRRHRPLLPQRLLPPAADRAAARSRRSSSSSTRALLPMTPRARRRTARRCSISVPLPGGALHARLWRVDVGRVPLLLLDSDVRGNAPAERAVTDRLYGGDSEHRLRQEILLGIGGVKALAACGIEPAVFHMNEGHAGFLAHGARARAGGGRRATPSTRCRSCARARCSRRTRRCRRASTASRATSCSATSARAACRPGSRSSGCWRSEPRRAAIRASSTWRPSGFAWPRA